MGNDPVNSVDPSGGCTWCQTLARALWLPNVTVVGHRATPSLAKKIGQVGLGVAKGVGKSLLNIITSSAILSSPQLFPKQSTEMIYGFGKALKAAGQISPVSPTSGLATLYAMDKYSRFTTGNRIQKGEVIGEVGFDVATLLIGGQGSIAEIGEFNKLAELGELSSEVSSVTEKGFVEIENVSVHGNSLKSTRPTWGYKLFSKDGTFLKNGITSKPIPETRYTKAFMKDKYMETVLFPNRLEAWQWEFEENRILPGPLNKNMH